MSEAVQPHARVGTVYYDEATGEYVMPPDFFGEKELRWKADPPFPKRETAPQGETAADSSQAILDYSTKDGKQGEDVTNRYEAVLDAIAIHVLCHPDGCREDEPCPFDQMCPADLTPESQQKLIIERFAELQAENDRLTEFLGEGYVRNCVIEGGTECGMFVCNDAGIVPKLDGFLIRKLDRPSPAVLVLDLVCCVKENACP